MADDIYAFPTIPEESDSEYDSLKHPTAPKGPNKGVGS